ncbi:MAG: hypothetical protein KDK33_10890, partial [Leptospiraceae bacterium]|nr:hypothetical protein [Leptospiraceae bacterium]
RFMAMFFRGLFADVNAYPVYRDGADVPTSEEDYRHPRFAGRWVTGMKYDQYLNYTRKQTAKSVLQVQKDMVEKNRSFVILPEGKYCHNGRIAELLDLAALAAHRKNRSIVYTSFSYEELCPDARGRIELFLYTNPPVEPPQSRAEFKDFMNQGRDLLQNTTVITASGILAAATIAALQNGTTIDRKALHDRFLELAHAVVKSDFLHDPRLADQDFLEDRWSRFLSRKASRWFAFRGQEMKVRPRRILDYDAGERTVPDLLWNMNNIIHAAPLLGIDTDWLDPENFKQIVNRA